MQVCRVLRTAIGLGALVIPAIASAQQPIGTYRWQLTPYCNVVTLSVGQQGAVFTLDGFDDQCGASQRAGVVGSAFPNPDGTIGIGLSTVLPPGGAFVHVDARISVATLAGEWRDSSGNAGTFAFTPGVGTGGPVRPVTAALAPGSVGSVHIAPGVIGSSHLAPGSVGASQIDPNQVQSRITGTCPVGQYLRAVQSTGAAVCEPLPPGPAVYYTARHEQVMLPAGGARPSSSRYEDSRPEPTCSTRTRRPPT